MRGDGTVYLKKGKPGQPGRYWLKYYVRGKCVREPGGFDGRGAATEKEALRKLRERLKEIHGGRFVGPKAERLSVGDVLDSYVAHLKQEGKRSVRTTECHLKPIRDAFSLVRAVDVTTERVRGYIDARMKEGKAAATINRETEALRAALRLAKTEQRLSDVPHVPHLKEENARQGFFERADFEAVAANLPDPIADVARFGFLSGWRKSEILGLRWEAVDRTGKEVRLATSKNGNPRTLPLEGELSELIERRWTAREYQRPGKVTAISEYVFHRNGKRVTDFTVVWESACDAASVSGRLFHDLRRTAVRNMVRAGVPQSVAMRISGHETDSMFRRYDIVSTDDQREALRQTESYLASRPSDQNVTRLKPEASR